MKKYLWKNAQEEIKKGNSFLVFTTNWCGDCQMMKPIFVEVEKELINEKINIKFVEVDAEESKLFKNKNSLIKVLKIPSLYVVKEGDMKFIGYEYFPKETIIKKIKNFIN